MSNQDLELNEINQIFQAVGGLKSEYSGEHKLRDSVQFLMDSTFKSEEVTYIRIIIIPLKMLICKIIT